MQDKTNKPTPEQVDSILRKAAKERSSWTLGHVLVLLALLLPPLACLGWMVWPHPHPPEVFVVAFDEVAPVGTEPNISAVLWPRRPEAEAVYLGGWPVLFQVGSLLESDTGQLVKTVSDESGWCSAKFENPLPAADTQVLVRYRPEYSDNRGEDLARVFMWPKDSQVVLVDVENSLTTDAKVDWPNAPLSAIAGHADAGSALQAMSKANFKVVYLACSVSDPVTYRKVRDWVKQRSSTAESPLPPGPVLGRIRYETQQSPHDSIKEHVKAIAGKFTGRVIAVSSHEETTNALAETDVATVYVGTELDDRGQSVESWEAFVTFMKKEE